MTPKAKLYYLTNPSPGVFIVNQQLEGQDDITRVEVTANHVRGLVSDGAAMAFRARENDSAHQSIRVGTNRSS